MTHLRAQGDSFKGACAAKCSNFDFEKFENSIIPLKGACAPMRGNMVYLILSWPDSIIKGPHVHKHKLSVSKNNFSK